MGARRSRIAFTRKKGNSLSDIYLIDADGSDLRAFTQGFMLLLDPEWSPDGEFIAFAQETRDCFYYYYYYECPSQILVGRAGSGLGQLTLLVTSSDNVYKPAWRPRK